MARFDVTIAGEINLDLILYDLPRELPLEQELLATGLEITLGSSSAITAHNLAALGSKVGFITRVGTDQFGSIALDTRDRVARDFAFRRGHDKQAGARLQRLRE